MPLLKVAYTSSHLKSQIYISSVNWCLLTAVIFITLVFRRSENLAAAYGLAVTGTIVLAAIPFATIVVWTMGQRALYRALKPLDLDTFLLSYSQIYAKGKNIPGTGLFFTRETPVVPPYVVHSIIRRDPLLGPVPSSQQENCREWRPGQKCKFHKIRHLHVMTLVAFLNFVCYR